MALRREFRDFVASIVSFPQDFLGAFSLPPSESGAIVNEFSAMQVSSYFSCIRVISDAVGMLPLNICERQKDGAEVVVYDHYLQPILHTQPNPDCTAADYRQTAQSHVLLTGNTFGEIIRNNAGQPTAIYLRSPFTTLPVRDAATGDLFYQVYDTTSSSPRRVDAFNMLHVKGWGIDSLVGMSPVRYYAREVLGIEISAQSYSAKFLGNQATPSGVLKAPGNLKPEQKLNAINSWLQAHGRGNSHTPAVLEGGWSWEQTGINPEEAQLISTRQLNRSQIAAMFGVPEHMIGGNDEQRATMEQKALEFLVFTLRLWLTKWEQAINAKLFPSTGRTANKFFAKFDTTVLERADYKTMVQALQMARYAGLITAQEGRHALKFNPYTQEQLTNNNPADKLLMPVNMVFVTEDMLDDDPAPAAGESGTDSETENEGGSNPAVAGASQPQQNSIKRYYVHFYPTFRDALNRITARKNPTEKDFQRTFSPVLVSIASAFDFRLDQEPGDMILSADNAQFIREYIAAMHHRASEWTAENGAEITSMELKRAIRYMEKKIPSEIEIQEQ